MSAKKKVLLLGSTGMLGGHFLIQLRKNPIKTINPLRNQINFEKLEKFLSNKRKLRKVAFGRFSLRSVSAKNFNDILFMLLKKDYRSLLKKYE